MKLLLVLISLFFLHDTPITFFEIHLERYPYEIQLEMDELYLLKINQTTQSAINWNIADVEPYLQKNISLNLNSKDCKIEYQNIQIKANGHAIIHGIIEHPEEPIIQLELNNAFYLDKNIKQINSVMIHQQEKELRGFKMDKSRTNIQVEL